MATRKYITSDTVTSPDNYKIAPGKPLSTISGGVDSHFNAVLYDIDDRLYEAETKLESIDAGATGDMTAEEIRDTLDADSSGTAIDAGSLDGRSRYELEPRVMTPRLLRSSAPDFEFFTSPMSTNRGQFCFSGKRIYAATGKNLLCWDPRDTVLSHSEIIVPSAPANVDYYVAAITIGADENLYILYDTLAGTDNYHLVIFDPGTEETISTTEITYSADVGHIKFLVYWRKTIDLDNDELVLVGDIGYIRLNLTTGVSTAIIPSEDVINPLGVIVSGHTGYDLAATPLVSPSIFVLWEANLDEPSHTLQRLFLDEAPGSPITESWISVVAGELLLWPLHMATTYHGLIWITGIAGAGNAYVVVVTPGVFEAGESLDYYLVGNLADVPFVLPLLLDSDGMSLMFHHILLNLELVIPSVNTMCYAGRPFFVDVDMGGGSIGSPPDIGLVYGANGNFGPDFYSAPVGGVEFTPIGCEFSGGHYWVWAYNVATETGWVLRAPAATMVVR